MEISKEENLKRLRDPKFYLENFTKIKGKTQGSLIPFVLNEAQKDLFNTLKKYSRIIINKARQLGTSTGSVGWIYHNTIINPGTTSALIGYNTQLTAELLDKVKTLYQSTPDELKPTIHYNSRWEISFPKINSKILVIAAGDSVGRGFTLNNVLATELPQWENAEEKLIALEASVPISGKLIIESTPMWVGDLFHRLWVTKDNGYVKKEYGWWWGYSREDVEIIKKRMNNPIKFGREMELKFLSTGLAVFDTDKIQEHFKNILKVGDSVKNEDGSETLVEKYGDWVIYKKPNPTHFYSTGVDSAEGLEGGDFSCAVIWDRTTGEEVAFYHRYIPPDIFAKELNTVGRLYNNALMVVEINNHGLTVVSNLKQLLYPNFYFRLERYETMGMTSSDRIGWKTNKMTRPVLIDEFDKAFREDLLLIHSKELLDEMIVFIYDKNGDMNATHGYKDDCIFAAAIGWQGFKVTSSVVLEQLNYSEFLPKSYAY